MGTDDRNRGQQHRSGQQTRQNSSQRPHQVLWPRNYKDRENKDATEFLRVGVAWPLKNGPGFSVELWLTPTHTEARDEPLRFVIKPPLEEGDDPRG